MKRRILVVEDNPLNSELLCDWLDGHGYEVIAVDTLSHAYAAIDEHRFDAVLLDIQLGDEDGADLALWIRRQPSRQNMPVIAVTAHALPAEQKRIIHAGCSAYVSKPIHFPTLEEIMLRLMAIGETESASLPGIVRCNGKQ